MVTEKRWWHGVLMLPEGSPAGEIAQALDAVPKTLRDEIVHAALAWRDAWTHRLDTLPLYRPFMNACQAAKLFRYGWPAPPVYIVTEEDVPA